MVEVPILRYLDRRTHTIVKPTAIDMKTETLHLTGRPYEAPAIRAFEIEVQAGYAVSYDPTEAIEKPDSDSDYEEW